MSSYDLEDNSKVGGAMPSHMSSNHVNVYLKVLTFDISAVLAKIASSVLANISYWQYSALEIVDPVPIPRNKSQI